MPLSYCPKVPGGKGETPTHFGLGGGPKALGVVAGVEAGVTRVAASTKGCGGIGSSVGEQEPEEVGVSGLGLFKNCCVKIRARSLPLSISELLSDSELELEEEQETSCMLKARCKRR